MQLKGQEWMGSGILFFLFCSIASFFLLRILLRYPTNLDEGICLNGAIRVLHGKIPYRDFFHITTPGVIWILAGIFGITGTNILPARIVIEACGLGLMVILFFFGNELFNNSYLSILPAIFIYFIDVFPHTEFSTHRPAIVCAMGALTILTFTRGNYGMFLAGACGGLSILMNQGIGACSLGGLVVLAWTKPFFHRQRMNVKNGMTSSFVLISGSFSLLLPTLIFLGFHGALKEFFYDTLVWPLNWYGGFNTYPYFYQELRSLKILFKEIAQSQSIVLNMSNIGAYLFGGFLPMIIYPCVLIGSFFKKEWIPYCLSIMGICLLFSSMNHPDSPHVFLMLPPLYPLAICALLSLAKKIKNNVFLAWVPGVPLFLSSFLILMNGFLFFLRAPEASPSFPFRTERGTLYETNHYGAYARGEVVRRITTITKPGERVFFYHWSPELYFLCDRDNPTRFDSYIPLYTSPDQMDELKNQLEKSRPRIIVKDNFIANILDSRSVLSSQFPFVDRRRLMEEDPVDRWVYKNYKEVTKVGPYILLEPRS